jgi:hypothetical protein
MMQWGCDVADALGVPGWIEASVSPMISGPFGHTIDSRLQEEGNYLYKRFGFYDYEKITEPDLGGTNMRRDARPKIGGR